jgi:hypothetical protein
VGVEEVGWFGERDEGHGVYVPDEWLNDAGGEYASKGSKRGLAKDFFEKGSFGGLFGGGDMDDDGLDDDADDGPDEDANDVLDDPFPHNLDEGSPEPAADTLSSRVQNVTLLPPPTSSTEPYIDPKLTLPLPLPGALSRILSLPPRTHPRQYPQPLPRVLQVPLPPLALSLGV